MSQAQNIILTHLSREDPEARTHMGRQMQTLQEQPAWQVFERLLDKAIEDARNEVESRLLEHVEYASVHGRIRGLKFAQAIPGAVIESGDRADLELRQIAAQENT